MATLDCGLACSNRPKIAFHAAICGGAPWLVQNRRVVLPCARARPAIAKPAAPAKTPRRDNAVPLRRMSENATIDRPSPVGATAPRRGTETIYGYFVNI